jgi:hypothetical protein
MIVRGPSASTTGHVDAHDPTKLASAGVTLLDALYAFYQEHERCGELDSAVDGDRVWMACTCGASISRCADDD